MSPRARAFHVGQRHGRPRVDSNHHRVVRAESGRLTVGFDRRASAGGALGGTPRELVEQGRRPRALCRGYPEALVPATGRRARASLDSADARSQNEEPHDDAESTRSCHRSQFAGDVADGARPAFRESAPGSPSRHRRAMGADVREHSWDQPCELREPRGPTDGRTFPRITCLAWGVSRRSWHGCVDMIQRRSTAAPQYQQPPRFLRGFRVVT
jgi:hypothetical protein